MRLVIHIIFFGAKFDKYVYGVTFIALIAFLVVAAFTLGRALSLGVDRAYKMLVISSVLLLIPASLGTAHSMPILQYVGDAFLLFALLLRYFDIRNERCLNLGYTISSFIYIGAFLFSFPLVNRTLAGNSNTKLYYALAFGNIAAIAIYMIMCFKLFSDKYKVATNPLFLVAMLAINAIGVVFAIGTEDFPGYFMFTFVAVGVTVVAYLVNILFAIRLKRRLRNSTKLGN
mgnify:CR=1 FL=1